MRNVLIVASHILRLGGTLAASAGTALVALWLFDQSTLDASANILAAAVVAIGAAAIALWGGGALARFARQQLTSDATPPHIAEKLG
jgi:hypothetical protein